MSETLIPAAASMSASVSAKGTPSCSATRRPTVDLPAPGEPTSTTDGGISGR